MKEYYADIIDGKLALMSGHTPIANFIVTLNVVKKYITENETVKKYEIEFNNGEEIFLRDVIPSELEKLDYTDIDDSLLLSPTVSTAAKEMAYYIKSQAKEADVKEIYLFDKLGWRCIGEKHCYCAGDTLIGDISPSDYAISDILSQKYKLEVDDMSEEEAFEYSFKIINIDPHITSVLFVSGLMGIMRQLILDADIRIPCVVYIRGNSQSRKTTTAKLCTSMYNRSKLHSDTSVTSMRVSSTNFKIEEISEVLKDSNFLLDDIYREQDSRLRRQYESHVRNIIRNFADNSSRNTARTSFAINCQIITTAEYLIKSKSDVGRIMLLNVSKPINSERLAQCQKNPLALSTFYYYFIKWLAEHYDETVSKLKAEYSVFRMGSHKHVGNFERLYEQFFLMKFVFGVYVDYALTIGIELNSELLTERFESYLKDVFEKQNAILCEIEAGEIKEINFSNELITMLNNKEICLGEKGSDCFRKGNFIYITNSLFGKKLTDKFRQNISSKRLSAYFRDKYISVGYHDNTDKKYNGKRYLTLNITELLKDAKTNDALIENLFF